ncbi:hypothetical protein [Sphingomonas sp. C3-2]|uniref:hypothetical protein n=1 Tax=Sphingomonas sp. C3-2 TaxID=3062169 RepID=UPI00294AA402|nr:hypothetical protein [Sphingomonas sp. C3-2]WOK36957.1 hypothetical protein QYC26_01815 [Sphingomonas sp. C3-2]
MKLVSKTALGLALAVGSVTMMAAVPAQAQKKEKPAKAPSLKLSKEFREAMAPVDAALKAGDFAKVVSLTDQVEATATTPDEKYTLNQYRLNAGDKLQDNKVRAKALDGMLSSGLVPAAEAGKFQFYLAKFSIEAKDYAKAEAALNAAGAAGYTSTDLYLTQASLYSSTNRSPQALAVLEKAVQGEKAAGKPVPEDWYKFGIAQAYKSNSGPAFARWTSMHVQDYPTPENWRSALVNYRDTQKLGSKIELDLFRLMRATRALAGEKDHYDYAFIANQQGFPGEAVAALDLLKAKSANVSPAINELHREASAKVAADKSGLAAEEKRANGMANGVLAAGTGNALLGYGEYGRAAALFRTALTKGGVDNDEVNMRLGIALAMQGQKEEAKKLFAGIKGQREGLAQLWTAYCDKA